MLRAQTVMQLQNDTQRGWYRKGKLKVAFGASVTIAVAASTAVYMYMSGCRLQPNYKAAGCKDKCGFTLLTWMLTQ